jgi:hypothetical protein
MDSYERKRKQHGDISGTLDVTTTTDDTTLKAVRSSNHTIYIQRIEFFVTTSAAQSMSFEDSNTSPKQIFEIPSSPADSSHWSQDWGPDGINLTAGKDFKMMVSAVGLAGQLRWYGYQKLTSVITTGTANTAN